MRSIVEELACRDADRIKKLEAELRDARTVADTYRDRCKFLERYDDDGTKERDALKATIADILRLGFPWPLRDIVRSLANATEHLLNDHDCDAEGHEERRWNVRRARGWLIDREKKDRY